MRTLAILTIIVAAACSSGNSNTNACSELRAHRTAIQTQMDAVDGNDDASIAAYNALVKRSNEDFAALKARGCSLVG